MQCPRHRDREEKSSPHATDHSTREVRRPVLGRAGRRHRAVAVVCPEKADGRQVPSVAMISTGVLMSALHLGSIEGQTRAAARTFEGAHGVTSGAPIEPERGVEPMRTPTAPGMTLDGPDAQLRTEQRDGSVDAVRAATSRAAATPMPTSEPVDARLEAASRASTTVTYGARSRGASRAVGPDAPAAVLIILLRDPDTGTLLSLGLSSGPDVGARVQRSDGEVWATLGPSLPIPPAPPAPPQALGALEFRDARPSALTGARITPWLTGPGAAPLVFGGLIDARAEAAGRGEQDFQRASGGALRHGPKVGAPAGRRQPRCGLNREPLVEALHAQLPRRDAAPPDLDV